MKYDDNNVFAKILRKEIPCDIIMENDVAIAFRDISPRARVHVLVVPKGRYVSFKDFAVQGNEHIVAEFFCFVNSVVEHLGIAESGFRLVMNSGKDALQEVLHFHVHILGGEELSH